VIVHHYIGLGLKRSEASGARHAVHRARKHILGPHSARKSWRVSRPLPSQTAPSDNWFVVADNECATGKDSKTQGRDGGMDGVPNDLQATRAIGGF
jgi:hypothetical protein